MGGGPGKGKDMPPSVVDYTIATGQELTMSILATGNLLPNETVEIRPERAGRLEKIYFKEGGTVQKVLYWRSWIEMIWRRSWQN